MGLPICNEFRERLRRLVIELHKHDSSGTLLSAIISRSYLSEIIGTPREPYAWSKFGKSKRDSSEKRKGLAFDQYIELYVNISLALKVKAPHEIPASKAAEALNSVVLSEREISEITTEIEKAALIFASQALAQIAKRPKEEIRVFRYRNWKAVPSKEKACPSLVSLSTAFADRNRGKV